MSRVTINVEGGLLPDDLLEKIAEGSAPGQRTADFGITSGRLSDEIMRAFSDARSYWSAFNHRYERALKGGRESITSVTRESFVIPFLEALGYSLEFRRSLAGGDQSFNISHAAGDDPTAPPVNIVSADDNLDERGSARRSAHSAVQEYLNVSDSVWGIATNGRKLRLLRNSSRLAKPRYIEFDLAGMMESNVYSDFHLLYRLLHRTRLPRSSADASECWLSKYYDEGVEQGSRVRDRLRDGVLDALKIFGNTFLAHPESNYLREQVAAGRLTPANYYRELLRLVYRLLFLMVAEERRLMFPDSRDNQDRRAVFTEHYGVNHLRARVEGYVGDDPEIDLWEGLKQTFHILRDDRVARMLGMAALNGELFGLHGCPHLDGGSDPPRAAFCRNDELLRAIDCLSKFDDDGVRRRVNFGALDVEELGSVYESLLEYHPQVSASPLAFDLAWGSERKSTGSYYTPPDLVRELINSALVPVMEERLKSEKSKEERERAILSMRLIDPAAGSGHFLLAAARRMGRELAKIRTGEEEPPPSAFRHAVRDVIRECIYAVDKNPLAVDLCKVALWIEGHNAGQPLSFLDHDLKCGDSLVGVFDLNVLQEGIPDDAYKAVEGDDKAAAKHYRALNRETKKNHPTLPQFKLPDDMVAALEALSHRDERTPEDVAAKEREYAELVNSPTMQNLGHACNAWTAAFFVPLRMPEFRGRDLVPTSSTVWERLSGRQIYGPLDGEIAKAGSAYSFFHWPVEFPDIFTRGGFDVVLGNPPWERIKIQEKEFFADRDSEIAQAPNKAVREKLIEHLPNRKPELAAEWSKASRGAEGQSKFVRGSGRFPLCGRGDVNTYAIFAEANRSLITISGRVGCIVPSGIALDITTKNFFQAVVESKELVSLFSFENEGFIFPAVHHFTKFCLLTLSGEGRPFRAADFVFFARKVAALLEDHRHFTLTAADVALLNPNTQTCCTFRGRHDAEITKHVYRNSPVLIRECANDGDPWGVSFLTMFHMANDSRSFLTRQDVTSEPDTQDGAITPSIKTEYLPLYEGKFLWQFNHRFSGYDARSDERGHRVLPESTNEFLNNPSASVRPYYWVRKQDVESHIPSEWKHRWLMGCRDITTAVTERTVVATVMPVVGVGHTCSLILPSRGGPVFAAALLANLNSLPLDYVARQKLGGTHLTFSVLSQLPVLPPESYQQPAQWDPSAYRFAWLLPRVLELTYADWSLESFGSDCGYAGPPFQWNPSRRFLLRCELDAAFFHFYGMSRSQLEHIADSFNLVRDRDLAECGEYRTKRMILEIYDEMEQAKRTGRPYQTRLDPPPGDPRAAHSTVQPVQADARST